MSVLALTERSNLTFDGVRGCLLFAGQTCMKRSSNRRHRNPLFGRLRERVAAIKRQRVLVEVNLTLRGESDVGNKHAYFMYGQNTRAELAMLPTPPATETHIPIAHAAVVDI